MQKIIITKGLPASGKTTWAKEFIKKYPTYKRINKDSLRDMLDDGHWTRDNEKHIIQCRNELIELCILNGFNVIVDDTNLHEKHFVQIAGLIENWKEYYRDPDGTPIKVKIETKDFTDVPLKECIENDLKRERSVGKDVIMKMYNQFLKPPDADPIKYNPKLPDCIICDIDGTLSHMTDRTAFEWDKAGGDRVDETIKGVLDTYSFMGMYEHIDTFSAVDCPNILLVSGRDEGCKDQTVSWLDKHQVSYDELFMRPKGDTRKDVEIKTEIYENRIKDKYNVLFVLDDRNQTVEGWRKLGLKCLQVQEGEF